MPLPVYKMGYKVMTPLTLPPLPAPLRSWGAAARAAAGELLLGALQYAGAWGKGPRLCPAVAAAVAATVRLPGVLQMSPGARGAEVAVHRHDLPPMGYLDAVLGGSLGVVEEAREDGEQRARASRMCCLTLRG